MDKIKNSLAKTGKYFREISVVVIGVAITLSVNVWITNSNNRKNLALYLNTIIIELNANAESFENQSKMFQKSARYADYIRLHDEKSLNKDSINYYAHSNDGYGWGVIQSATIYGKDAFEMFKTSGAMRQINDKELLMSIWGTYAYMENVQLFIEMGFQRKREESMIAWQLSLYGKSNIVPMQLFYSADLPYQMVQQCKDMAERIRETVSKLEESKMVKR